MKIEKWMSVPDYYNKESTFIGVCVTLTCLDGKTRLVNMRLKDGVPQFYTEVVRDGKSFGSTGAKKLNTKIYGKTLETELMNAYKEFAEQEGI